MNKRNTILSLALFFGNIVSLYAQDVNVTTTETYNYDDEEIVIGKDNGDEEIIEVPEGMLLELDSLVQQYNAKTYLMADTSCQMRDVNPVYDIEVYKDRLKRLPTAMEMPWNDVVQKFIDRYFCVALLAICLVQAISICQSLSRLLRFMEYLSNLNISLS